MQKRLEKDMYKLACKRLAGLDDMDALLKGIKGALGEQLRLVVKCTRICLLFDVGRIDELRAVARSIPLVTREDMVQAVATVSGLKVRSGSDFGGELLLLSLWCCLSH